jgi:Carboxypeptidase regulatory-like domain/TonB dependent receptor
MSRKILFSAVVLLTFLFAVTGFAQTTASIQGTVTDSTGAAIKGAKVTVKSVSQGIERTTETSDTGSYQIPALPPGTYTVEIQGGGFQTQQATNVVVSVSQNAVQNFGLKPATASEVVSVEATTPVIETTTMTVGQTIDQRTVQDIPLNGRHFVDLALLVPGTVTPPQNGFLTAPLRGQGSFAFNSAGGREDAVNFMINGVNLNDMVQNQVTFQPTINTVSEFKIDNSTYSAEYGRNSGSIVNIGTRSGTNQYHGEFYDYLRNNFFDARNAFNRLNQPQSSFKRNQYGADFGGPIYKDKTFFFLSYEGVKQRQGLNLAGNVFQASDLAKIQASPNATVRALAALVPAANGTLNNLPAFFSSPTAPVNIDQGTADISHNFNDKDALHGYYAYQNDFRGEPGMGTNIAGFGDTREGHRQVLTINETHVFSPNVVNEVRAGANRILINFVPQNATNPASVGLAGTLGPNLAFLPRISIGTGGANLLFGSERTFPQSRGDTTFVLADTVSYIHGRHSFKFGSEFRDFRNNNANSDPGQIVFNNVASFIAGTPDTAANVVGNVASRINENALDFFAQDSWKLKPYLTVELGLRYAWNMTPSEANNRFVNFIPNGPTGSLLVPTSQPYGQNNKNFQPRVGFSWDVFHNSKTVLRGGYAYQVDQPITGFVTGLTSNPNFALPISVTNQTALSALNAQFNGKPIQISPTVIDPNFKNADTQSFNLNIQQQIDNNTSFMVGYFGTKGTHLELEQDINQFGVLGSPQNFINPANKSLGTLNPTRPFQSLSPNSPILPGTLLGNSLTERFSGSNSNYNALWITANRRLSHGLQFNASYTWSHSIDDVSRNNNGIVIQDSTNIASGRGSSDFDVRHRFVVNAIYDLPFKGNRFKSGWELAPIVSLQSGNPFTVTVPSSLITGVANVAANAVGPITVTGNPLGQWILPTNFAAPTTTFGNTGRNGFTGPGFTNVDLALIKNIKLTERFNAQFVANAFDIFNHPNYGQPNSLFNPATPATLAGFGVISSTRFPVGDSGSARQMQFAVKLQF